MRLQLILATLALTALAAAQSVNPAFFSAMQWRLIGPFRAGRVSAVAGIAGDPATYYIGTPGGGVFKSTSGGEVWTPVFDQTGQDSIGAIAVAPSNPNIVYVGTGDVDNVGGSVNQGDGMWKSTDAGATWSHIGLDDSRHIAAIVVDPHNPDIVIVAALGHTFATNSMRGIYRSADGGATWQHVLDKGDAVGAISLVADPDNAMEMFAGLEQHAPAPGGRGGRGAGRGGRGVAPTPGAGIYKSTDEGATWTEVSGGGLPDRDLGRIGVAIAAHTQGKRVFAITTAGLYRSDDAGATWTRSTTDPRIAGSSYFSEVYVSPANPDTVYVVQTSFYRSNDGGRTFAAFKGAPGGDDYHEVWIDPTNADRMILGVDQGETITLNGGRDWSLGWYNLPNGQFYHIATDDRFPYWVFGTEQDSGSAAVANRGDFGEITFMDWLPSVGAYEFGYIHPDPRPDSNYVFATGGGTALNRYDRATKQIYDVTPPASGGWRYSGSPQAFSPKHPGTFYLGAQAVLATDDLGLHWRAISPDLTGPGGRGAITALAPSATRDGEFWVGTSTGLVQMSTGAAAPWKNVTPPGLPEGTSIEAVEASPLQPGTAFVVFERHTANVFAPYIYRTTDSGATWTKIVNGIPDNDFVHVVRADPKRAGLLYAGAEHGVFVSFDNGSEWQPLQLNLPHASVRDLVVHGDDLVAATYGRALWILDDIAPLRTLAAQPALDGPTLFPPASTIRVQPDVNYDTPFPPEMATGANPPEGAVLDYYLPTAADGGVKLSVYDDTGKLVRSLTSTPPAPAPSPQLDIPNYWLAQSQPLPASAGMHRVVWDLRYTTPPSFDRQYPISALLHGTPADPRGPFVAPGRFTVVLAVGGQAYRQPLTVTMDPRIHVGPAALVAQRDLALRISHAMEISYAAAGQLNSLGAVPEAAQAEVQTLRGSTGGRGRRGGGRGAGGAAPSFAALNGQLGNLISLVELSDNAPSPGMVETYTAACQALRQDVTRWNTLKSGPLASLHFEPTPLPSCTPPYL